MSPWPPEGEPEGKGTKPVTLPRPGHADLAGVQKYGLADVRDALERASARHTAVHVAAGAVAKALLAAIGVRRRRGRTPRGGSGRGRRRRRAQGQRHARRRRRGARAGRPARARLVRAQGGPARRAARGRADGDPGGEGRRDRRRLRARARARLRGARRDRGARPPLDTNRAGGIEAGMSNGEEIVVRAAMKPLPTLMKPLASVDLETGEPAQALVERSDVVGGRGARGRRRGGGRVGARARGAREVRRRRARRLRRRMARVRRSGSTGFRARHARRARRLHGRREDDARRASSRCARISTFSELDRTIEHADRQVDRGAVRRARRGGVPRARGARRRDDAARAAARSCSPSAAAR